MKNNINCLSLSPLQIKKWRIYRHGNLGLVYARVHGALLATIERVIY